VLPVSNGGRSIGVFRTGETYLSGRVHEDPEEVPGIREALKVRSAIGVPLEIGGGRRGMLMLASQEADFFTEADARFMETVARWVGVVTHRAELAEQIGRNATEQGRRAGAEELVTVLAHDLRNYLAPLTMRLHLVRLRAARAAREEELRDIDLLGRSINRLGELVNDILDVSRIDRGVFQNPIELTVQEGDAIHAAGDPARLRQCLENVIANAIQKSPASAAINIFVRREQPANRPPLAMVGVVDEGPGIPPEQLPHVFERFHSGLPGGRESGLGLGLYLAKRIAAVHGGDLTADSEPGRGARFTLSLPALDDAA
jgi:signal transduction histidine kinase